MRLQLIDDGCRRAPGRNKPKPDGDLVHVRHLSGDDRQIGHRRERARIELGQHAERSALNERERRGGPVKGKVHTLGEHGLRHFGAAVVGHEHGVDSRRLVEEMAGELGGNRASAVVKLAGVLLRLGDQILHRLHVACRIDDQQLHRLRGERDRGKVVEGIVRRGAVKVLVHGQRRVDRHEQGVAVGRCLGDLLRAQHRIGAGTVLDQNRLPPILVHLLADHAREYVRGATGGERHDDLDGSAGKCIRPFLRGSARYGQGREDCKRDATSSHGVPFSID